MNIIVATTTTPFLVGGASLLVDSLSEMLQVHGHQVETLRFPFSFQADELLPQLVAMRLLDLSQHGDRLIAIRTPSYLLQHPQKVVWFIHHHRPAYDLWNTQYCDLPSDPGGLGIRDALRSADTVALHEARRVFSNSQVVSERLAKFNGVAAETLYPPLLHPERYQPGEAGDYIFYLSRMTHHKRQWLALEAMLHTRTAVRLILAGKPDPGAEPYVEDLRTHMRQWGLEERVVILPYWIPEDEKLKLLANCLAVAYFPLDEDSYGYPSLEAQQCQKPVLATTDSGGTRELIHDRENGILCSPDPKALAGAMDEFFQERELAKRLGRAGPDRIRQMKISWDHVLERLLA